MNLSLNLENHGSAKSAAVKNASAKMSRRGREHRQVVTVIGNGQAQAVAQPAQVSPSTQAVQPLKIQVSFDDWYLQKQHGRNWRPEMKEALRRHLTACGFMKTGDFENGLKHFGIKS